MSNRGFTLIELLISVAVLSIISGILIGSFVSLTASYDRADVTAKVNHEGNRVLAEMIRLVRNSNNATLVGSDLVLTIPESSINLEYSTNGSCRIVRLKKLVLAGNDAVVKSSSASDCATASPVCNVVNANGGCKLNSDDTNVGTLTFTVRENDVLPDEVTITFMLGQDASLSDAQQQAELQFRTVVSTRGY